MPQADAGPKATVHHRDNCRLCTSSAVELVLPLAATPPADAYVPRSRLAEPQDRFPLDLYMCRDCGHAQLLDVVDPEVLFGDYIYVTTSSPGLVEHFRQYAEWLETEAGPLDGKLAVDIGSNDGTLLRFLQGRGMRALGVDAAEQIARDATASGVETIGGFFTSGLGARLKVERGAASVVTANNVFAHADDLGDIADGIRALLAPGGIFVFEVSYLVDLVTGKVFDYIYHEHLAHHSVRPLQGFLKRHGMELVGAERVGTKGGSLRCTAQLAAGPRSQTAGVRELVRIEDELRVHEPETFKALARELDGIKSRLAGMIRAWQAEGKTIAGYGASATVTTLVYHFDLGDSLSFIVDDNPRRQGLYSPGLHIPVVAPGALYERKPDVVIILAWRFAEPILKAHQRYLKQGGRFIMPLPEIRVI